MHFIISEEVALTFVLGIGLIAPYYWMSRVAKSGMTDHGGNALRGADDKGFEDKLYSLVAFKGFSAGAAPTKFVFDPKTGI